MLNTADRLILKANDRKMKRILRMAQLAAKGRVLPEYVEREFDGYLKCGRLKHGLLRVRCEICYDKRLVGQVKLYGRACRSTLSGSVRTLLPYPPL